MQLLRVPPAACEEGLLDGRWLRVGKLVLGRLLGIPV